MTFLQILLCGLNFYDVLLTGALDKQLLSMAAQQCTGKKGGKIDKDLPQERSRLFKCVLQALRDAESKEGE